MKIDLKLLSSHFNLASILEKKVSPRKKKEASIISRKKIFMHYIEKLVENVEVGLALDIHKFEYKRFKVNNLKGHLFMSHRELRLDNIVTDFESGGIIKLNAKQMDWLADTSRIELKTSMVNIKASHLFFVFNNFNQATIQEHNLEGRIDASIQLACKMDKSHMPIQESMQGKISFVLSNGRLKNFEPLKSVSRLIFKKRDLSNIGFESISDNFILKGSDMHIQKMQINSSAISLILEGIYSFKGKTNLSVKIPFSNLKKRHETYYRIEEKEHGNLLLRAIEKNGKVAIILDPFNRHKRSSE